MSKCQDFNLLIANLRSDVHLFSYTPDYIHTTHAYKRRQQHQDKVFCTLLNVTLARGFVISGFFLKCHSAPPTFSISLKASRDNGRVAARQHVGIGVSV